MTLCTKKLKMLPNSVWIILVLMLLSIIAPTVIFLTDGSDIIMEDGDFRIAADDDHAFKINDDGTETRLTKDSTGKVYTDSIGNTYNYTTEYNPWVTRSGVIGLGVTGVGAVGGACCHFCKRRDPDHEYGNIKMWDPKSYKFYLVWLALLATGIAAALSGASVGHWRMFISLGFLAGLLTLWGVVYLVRGSTGTTPLVLDPAIPAPGVQVELERRNPTTQTHTPKAATEPTNTTAVPSIQQVSTNRRSSRERARSQRDHGYNRERHLFFEDQLGCELTRDEYLAMAADPVLLQNALRESMKRSRRTRRLLVAQSANVFS